MKKLKYIIPPVVVLAIVLLCMSVISNIYTLMIATLGEFNQTVAASVDVGTNGLSDEVESYRELVIAEANANNKLEYVPLFMAVMMQESGGRGNDVFQCSEYLGKESSEVTVQESIKGGVELLSSNLDRASVTSPQEILKIKLALQGYNFGAGYITYALERDGKWTQENTNDFAKEKSNGKKRNAKKARAMGIWAYGDQYYTSHVLRYYNCSTENADNSENSGSNPNEGAGRPEVVEIAKKLIGCEYEWGYSGEGMQFDCSGLVYYCYTQAGYSLNRLTADGFRTSSSCKKITEEELEPGDLIFYQKKDKNDKLKPAHHVALYVGNGMIIHAKGEKYGVVYDESSYGSKNVRSFGRITAERKKK